MKTKIKKIIITFIACSTFIFLTTSLAQEVYAVNATKRADIWTIYQRAARWKGGTWHPRAIIKRKYSENNQITIGHNIYAALGSEKSDVCIDEPMQFVYDPTFTFTGGNGSWDTPYGKWVSSINQNRKGESRSSTYWNRISDGGSNWGDIAWSGVKPSVWTTGSKSGKVYITSSDNSIVDCSGGNLNCVPKKDGTVTLTAHFPSVPIRYWGWATHDHGKASGWFSETFNNPKSVSSLAETEWMFCPTVEIPYYDHINYCGNRTTIGEATESWTVTVGEVERCYYCGDGINRAPEECDTSDPSHDFDLLPADNCIVEGYGDSCSYCVSPGNPFECTIVPKRGPHCGDGILNGPEVCDAGEDNGVLCGGSLDYSNPPLECTYCTNICEEATDQGPHCGDDIINGTEEQCDRGTLPPWAPSNASCTDNCTLIYQSECVSPELGVTNTTPTGNICSNGSSLFGTPSLGSDGRWHWTCRADNTPFLPPPPAEGIECSAPTCISEGPINYTSPVIISDDMSATISVDCPGSSQNMCCRIEATEVGSSDPGIVICTGDSDIEREIEIVEGGNNFPAQCWFEEPGCTDRVCDSNCEECVDKTFSVQTACIAKSCNAQGTCQSTPVVAPNRNASQCTSSCNSNADCTRGRLIETKP